MTITKLCTNTLWITTLLFLVSTLTYTQDANSGNTLEGWTNQNDKKLLIGAYGEVHYNQELNSRIRNNGIIDVHRLVLLNGYNFSKKASFLTEIEFEHVNEVTVEQAFFRYNFDPLFQFKAGLILIPMGIVNEYHESTTFFSVERPILDKTVVPSTWREIGAGFTGNSIENSIKYQVYIINGFLGYDGTANISGSSGFRNARQKGIKSTVSSPNISAKINYYGLSSTNIGLSLFAGKTESSLYDGLDKTNAMAVLQADSSAVQMQMFGVDFRHSKRRFHVRGQANWINIENSAAYNAFTGSDSGKQIIGSYIEMAYHAFLYENASPKISLFSRLEYIDTHFRTNNNMEKNSHYANTYICSGINWVPANGLVVKIDHQLSKSMAEDAWNHQLNAGVGFWFR